MSLMETNAMHAPRDLPRLFVAEIDGFKEQMALADRLQVKERLAAGQVQPIVSSACTRLRDLLREHASAHDPASRAVGAYAFRETFPFVTSSRFLDVSYTKPRGYAGDYDTLDIVYDNQPAGHGRLGPLIDRWALADAPCAAVRHRRRTICGHIARVKAARGHGVVEITSLAVGPGREIFDALADDAEGRLRFTGIDIDPRCVEFVARRARAEGASGKLKLIQANIVRLAQGKATIDLQPQRLVYSVGLMDYLEDPVVVACLDWMFDMLEPGGEAIIGNFDSNNPTRAFMDHVLEWVLIHRTPAELRRLFERSKFAGRPVEVSADTTDVQLFARCVK